LRTADSPKPGESTAKGEAIAKDEAIQCLPAGDWTAPGLPHTAERVVFGLGLLDGERPQTGVGLRTRHVVGAPMAVEEPLDVFA